MENTAVGQIVSGRYISHRELLAAHDSAGLLVSIVSDMRDGLVLFGATVEAISTMVQNVAPLEALRITMSADR